MTKKLPAAKGFIKISKKYGEMYPLRAFIKIHILAGHLIQYWQVQVLIGE